jgi:hypothetical protein
MGLTMPSERLDDDIIRDPEKSLLREQAQTMLDLFAEDCGRTPVTRKKSVNGRWTKMRSISESG